MKLHTHIAGTRFNNRTCGSLKYGQELRLIREPENPTDKNAIRIETLDQRKVGYVPMQMTGLIRFPVTAAVDPKGLWQDDHQVWMVVSMSGDDGDSSDASS